MSAPTLNCPTCGTELRRVVDAPYGWWEWDGEAYAKRYTSKSVSAPEFACAECLTGLPEFHPMDAAPVVVAPA